MAHDSIPANAREHHARLIELGVVSLVTQILTDRDETFGISNLLCWAAQDNGQLVVKAAYTHQRAALSTGKALGSPVPDSASFGVSAGRAFGPLGSKPLPAPAIAAIRALAA